MNLKEAMSHPQEAKLWLVEVIVTREVISRGETMHSCFSGWGNFFTHMAFMKSK